MIFSLLITFGFVACVYALAAGVAVVLILPHRIGPPLGYGKRRTDDGKEALQA